MNKPVNLCFLLILATGLFLGCEADSSPDSTPGSSDFNAPPPGNDNQGGFYTWEDDIMSVESTEDAFSMDDVNDEIDPFVGDVSTVDNNLDSIEPGGEFGDEFGDEVGDELGDEVGDDGGDEFGDEEGGLPSTDTEGGILILEIDTDLDFNTANVGAAFGPPLVIEPAAFMIGQCRIDGAADENTSPEPSLDAGTLSITGTTTPATLTWESVDNVFTYVSSLSENQADLLGAAGDLISIEGNGGMDVPAFSGTMETPPRVEIKSPALGLTTSIDTSNALTVSWNGGTSAGTVLVVLGTLDYAFQPMGGPTVTCILENDPGTYTVPSEAMKELPSSLLSKVIVSVTRIHTTTLDADGVPVHVNISHTQAGIANAK